MSLVQHVRRAALQKPRLSLSARVHSLIVVRVHAVSPWEP